MTDGGYYHDYAERIAAAWNDCLNVIDAKLDELKAERDSWRAIAEREFDALELAFNYPQPVHVMDEINAARHVYLAAVQSASEEAEG